MSGWPTCCLLKRHLISLRNLWRTGFPLMIFILPDDSVSSAPPPIPVRVRRVIVHVPSEHTVNRTIVRVAASGAGIVRLRVLSSPQLFSCAQLLNLVALLPCIPRMHAQLLIFSQHSAPAYASTSTTRHGSRTERTHRQTHHRARGRQRRTLSSQTYCSTARRGSRRPPPSLCPGC